MENRDNCSFQNHFDGEIYCDMFDFGCRMCYKIEICPNGLDDDDDGESCNNCGRWIDNCECDEAI